MNSVFYPYRVYLSSGNAFQVYREERDELELWESVKGLREADMGFSYFSFSREQNMIPGLIDPKTIIAIDRVFGIKPIDLDERKRNIEEAKERASGLRGRSQVCSTAIDITKRK